MQIVIDCTSVLLPSAGVKTHIYYWARSLLESSGEDTVRLFPFLPELPPLTHTRSLYPPMTTAARLLLVHLANLPGNPALELLSRADVFHASQHLRNPPRRRARLTATIFDMTCWLMPNVHTPANVEATKAYGRHVLQRAAACIANSEQTRRDALEILRLPEDRVVVVYPGVADAFFTVTPEAANAVARCYGLGKPYLLYIGAIEPRKNIDGLLDAYAALPAPLRDEYELVIAGPLGWVSAGTRRRLETPESGVRYLGYVGESDLPGLTAAAAMFVFPSFYEGFGLPVAQALACGVPVITSSGSSLGEITAGHALLIDPRCTDEIAGAIERLAGCAPLREKLARGGRERAAEFRWDRVARRSLEFFHRAARM